MLPPHPELRLTDLTQRPSAPSLSALVDGAGVRRFYSARTAIYHLARALRADGRDRMLLPAFHCPSVVEPVLRAGMRPVFYRIDRKLEVDLDDVRRRLDDDVAAALFINFLGFPSGFEPLLPELRARGILAVEDCAHAAVSIDPLELAGRRADAAIYSFWKLVPSGVGGGLWLSPQAQVELPPLERAPLKNSVVRAKRLAEEVINGLGEDSLVARAYGLAEQGRVRAKRWLARASHRADPGEQAVSSAMPAPEDQAQEYFFSERLAHSRLPWMSERIMSRVDLAAIVRARRDNYQTLAARLDPPALIRSALPALPPRISPLAYPVLVPDRSSHDLRLRARDVPVWTFGSTLHRVLFESSGSSVIEDAKYLSDTLLLISVHQLISHHDTCRFAQTINEYRLEEASCALN